VQRSGFRRERNMWRTIHRQWLSIYRVGTRSIRGMITRVEGAILTVMTNVRKCVSAHHRHVVAMRRGREMVGISMGRVTRGMGPMVAIAVMSIRVIYGQVVRARV